MCGAEYCCVWRVAAIVTTLHTKSVSWSLCRLGLDWRMYLTCVAYWYTLYFRLLWRTVQLLDSLHSQCTMAGLCGCVRHSANGDVATRAVYPSLVCVPFLHASDVFEPAQMRTYIRYSDRSYSHYASVVYVKSHFEWMRTFWYQWLVLWSDCFSKWFACS